MRRTVPLLLVLASAACASPLRDDYERGAVTPFARDVVAASRTPADPAEPPAAAEDEAIAKVEARLTELEAEWRAKEASRLARPEEFGLVAADVTTDDLTDDLSLPEVLGAAYSMSPAVAAARDALRATVEQFDQVAYLDTILRQYKAFTRDLDLRIGAPRQKEMVEAFFPFPGTMALKTDIVLADATAAEERLAKTTRKTLVAAGRSYFAYAYLGQAVGIVTENIELLRGMVEIAESRYGVGKAGQSVVLRLHVEISALEDRLVTLKEQRETERSRLSSILGLAADFPLGTPGDPTAEEPVEAPGPLYPVARRERQELEALRAKIARTEALIELAETKAYPDLSLGFSRFEEKGMTRVGGARMVEPFSEDPAQKPRFWFGETASFIEEMKQRLAGMRQELADLEVRTEFLVKDAWFKWDAAWRQAELHRTSLLPQAEQAYRVLESGWQEGVADFLDALDAQRTWLRYQLEYREAVKDTNAERLSLIDALGTGIPDEAADGGDDEGR